MHGAVVWSHVRHLELGRSPEQQLWRQRVCGAPVTDIGARWLFCKDHPFGVTPEPYKSGLPAGFPSHCTIQ